MNAKQFVDSEVHNTNDISPENRNKPSFRNFVLFNVLHPQVSIMRVLFGVTILNLFYFYVRRFMSRHLNKRCIASFVEVFTFCRDHFVRGLDKDRQRNDFAEEVAFE